MTTTTTPSLLAKLLAEHAKTLDEASNHRANGALETAASFRSIAAGLQRAIDILNSSSPSKASSPEPIPTTPASDLTAGQEFCLCLDAHRGIYTYTGKLDSQGYLIIKPVNGEATVTTYISPNTKVFLLCPTAH